MTWSFYVICVLVIILLALLVGATFLLVRLGQTILNLEEQIEESLDILDECHRNIHKITVEPVSSDDPLVRQVLVNIRKARDAILVIADKIVVFNKDKESYGNE